MRRRFNLVWRQQAMPIEHYDHSDHNANSLGHGKTENQSDCQLQKLPFDAPKGCKNLKDGFLPTTTSKPFHTRSSAKAKGIAIERCPAKALVLQSVRKEDCVLSREWVSNMTIGDGLDSGLLSTWTRKIRNARVNVSAQNLLLPNKRLTHVASAPTSLKKQKKEARELNGSVATDS